MPRQRREETAQRWASRLAQFENSNLSVAQFCQSIDCSIGSFYLWKRKLAKPTPAPSAFLRVQSKRSPQGGARANLPWPFYRYRLSFAATIRRARVTCFRSAL